MPVAMDRRTFLRSAAVAGVTPSALLGQSYTAPQPATAPPTEHTVMLFGDSVPQTPQNFLAELSRQVDMHPNVSDAYLVNGAVQDLEHMFAALVGKEDCAYMPTGTLANNLAVRILAGEHKHVLVQAESHLYCDESDAASILSGLTLVPLAPGKANPGANAIAAAIEDAAHRPYPIKVGAISLESPVRRQNGESIPYSELQAISKLAKENGIGMHWDGARSMMLSGTPGFDMKATAALFDTVYMSLYKYLGAPGGAVLAGSKEFIAQAKELRHIYGGLVYRGWMSALPALASMPTFPDRLAKARVAGNQIIAKLQHVDGFSIMRVPNESNIIPIKLSPARLDGLVERLAKQDIRARTTKDGILPFFINESTTRRSPDDIVTAIVG